jgi:enoyl-CoA hydratase
MTEPHLAVQIDGPIATLRFCNPPKFNAMTLDMWQAFPARLAELDANPDVRAIVLRGAGEAAFVSGADISQFKDKRTDPAQAGAYAASVEAAYAAPINLGKPVIAAISGICMGGGLGIAAACDVRIASANARFRMPAARLGIGYSVAGVSRFIDVLGLQNTCDIFLSARTFGAADAISMGFLKEVVAAGEADGKSGGGVDGAVDGELDVFARAQDIARQMAENAPLTLRAFKRAVRHLTDPAARPVPSALKEAIAACAASDDYKEGQRAFAEKRLPMFLGR